MALERCELGIQRTAAMLGCLSAYNENRFVLTSTSEVKERQAKQTTDIKAEITNLEKKLHYLDTTYKNSQQHIEQLFKRAG